MIPFGVMLELEVAPLLLLVPFTALLKAVLEVLLDALLAMTGEAIGEPLSSATATDGVEVGAIGTAELDEAVELGETAPGGA